MGKIKEKMYNLLVRKNENIRYEYESYVQQNLDEHQEHRGRHWKLILKLNWHYRILRRKTPCLNSEDDEINTNENSISTNNVNTVQSSAPVKAPSTPVKAPSTPVKAPSAPAKASSAPAKSTSQVTGVNELSISCPESSAFNRQKPFHLAFDLLRYDVISFDIFDTLLFRTFHNPADLFSVVGKRLNFPAIFTSFKQGRMDAEKEARGQREREYGTREVDIYEIYEVMNRKFNIDVETGVNVEMQTEEDYLFANPYMKIVYDILRAHGKSIVITSDMYIPGEIMTRLLKKCGYEGYDKLYVSCDYRCNKMSGELFRRVQKDYQGKKIIHVGDNNLSDINGAKVVGIETRYYKNVNEVGKAFRPDWMSNLTLSTYAGLVNAYLHNGLNKYPFFYEYGFVYGGIYMCGFCNWLDQKAKSEGIDKIIFLSRDGDICQKMYDKYFGNVSTDYMYWSRFINIKYLIEMQQDAFIERVVKQKANGALDVELSSVLKSFSIELPEKELRKYGLSSECIITKDSLERIGLCIRANWDTVVSGYEREREMAVAEVKSLLGNAKKVAVIDVGWTGSGPIGFKAFIERYVSNECEIKCWMAGGVENYGAKDDVLPEYMDESMATYLFSPMHNKRNEQIHMNDNTAVNNNAVFELFTQAQYPSYRGRTRNGGYEFDIPENENFRTIGEVQKGIMDFCELFYKTFSKDPYLYNVSGFDAYRPFAKLVFNKQYFEKNFRDIVYGYGFSGDLKHQCIETIGSRMDKIYKNRRR